MDLLPPHFFSTLFYNVGIEIVPQWWSVGESIESLTFERIFLAILFGALYSVPNETLKA